MAFINKKEEVIQIRLTQFGKSQLSKGRLKPHYYAFFDDDIIYDAAHASSPEEQNEIEDRIKDNVRLDLQHSSTGVETKYLKETELIRQGKKDLYEPLDNLQETEEKEKLLKNILGHSIYGKQEAPYYTLESLGTAYIKNENMEVTFHTGSEGIKIPQVEFNPEYKIFCSRKKKRDPLKDTETFVNLLAEDIEFLDGTEIHLEKDTLLFSLVEDNVSFLRENFEFELFEINNEQDEERLIPIEDNKELFEIKKDKKISNYEELSKKFNRGLFNK